MTTVETNPCSELNYIHYPPHRYITHRSSKRLETVATPRLYMYVCISWQRNIQMSPYSLSLCHRAGLYNCRQALTSRLIDDALSLSFSFLFLSALVRYNTQLYIVVFSRSRSLFSPLSRVALKNCV